VVPIITLGILKSDQFVEQFANSDDNKLSDKDESIGT
jgi:hypothetical protein